MAHIETRFIKFWENIFIFSVDKPDVKNINKQIFHIQYQEYANKTQKTKNNTTKKKVKNKFYFSR